MKISVPSGFVRYDWVCAGGKAAIILLKGFEQKKVIKKISKLLNSTKK